MCNLNSNGDRTIKRLNLGYVFLGESKNGFVISDHMDSPLPKKWKIRKRFIYHDSNMSSCKKEKIKKTCPRALRGKKNNKLILTAKTRSKSNINYI